MNTSSMRVNTSSMRAGKTATLVTLVAAALASGGLVSATAHAAPTASVRAVPSGTGTIRYADDVVRAWGRGDRRATARIATAAVTNQLFAYSSPGGVHWRRVLSEGAAGTEFVTYHDDARGGYVTVGVSSVVLSNGGGHAAYRVRFSQARPVAAAGYADALVRAWGRGDRRAAARYATPQVVRALFAHASPGGGHWRRTDVQGAAGTIYVTYRDDDLGGHLTLGVNDLMEQDGQYHAVYTQRFTR